MNSSIAWASLLIGHEKCAPQTRLIIDGRSGFSLLFDAWYDKSQDKARDMATLVAHLEKHGTNNLEAVCDEDIPALTAAAWRQMDATAQEQFLLHYRLTYLAETEVNWCPALGTVLANDEVIQGVSERGGHPVERKK